MDMTSSDFPYGESIQWISPEKERNLLPPPLMEWLNSKDSLTSRLKHYCQEFDVKILKEAFLPSHKHVMLWHREVLLSLDDSPWIFACTLIPKALVADPTIGLSSLGNRPLGELLYSNKGFIPGPIEIAQIGLCHQRLSFAEFHIPHPSDLLWGRRRYFYYKEYRLVVYEVFLPEAERGILNFYKQVVT